MLSFTVVQTIGTTPFLLVLYVALANPKQKPHGIYQRSSGLSTSFSIFLSSSGSQPDLQHERK
jgi:hypothetical protein